RVQAKFEGAPSGQVVLNMGTWLKLLHRVPVHFGLLPAVYYPSYRLNYFCIESWRLRTHLGSPDTKRTLAAGIPTFRRQLGAPDTPSQSLLWRGPTPNCGNKSLPIATLGSTYQLCGAAFCAPSSVVSNRRRQS